MQGNCKDLFLKIPKIFTTFLLKCYLVLKSAFSDHYLLLYFGYSECLAENDMKNSPIFVRLLFYLTDFNNSP